MHGDIGQNQREVTLKRFKEGKFNVLVATDVASRGLDIPNVDLVIQVEPPTDAETYIHRSGRTARAGYSGTCITFFTKKTQGQIQMIESQAGIKFKIIGAPQPEDVIRSSARGIMRKLDDVSDNVLDLFSDASKQITEKFKGDKDKALQACLAYLSGHYKSTLVNRSLLSGQEKQTTLEMAFEPVGRGESVIDAAWAYIQNSVPQKQQDAVKGMRAKRDGSGVVFDVWEDKAERFTYAVEYVRERDGHVNFDIFKCKALPELVEEEDSFDGAGGGQWRSQGGYSGGGGYGGRGGYSGGGYGGGYKSQGSYGGSSRGGYGGRSGYGDDNGGSNRGGYGRGYNAGGNSGSDWRSSNQDSGSSRGGGYGRGYGGGGSGYNNYQEKQNEGF